MEIPGETTGTLRSDKRFGPAWSLQDFRLQLHQPFFLGTPNSRGNKRDCGRYTAASNRWPCHHHWPPPTITTAPAGARATATPLASGTSKKTPDTARTAGTQRRQRRAAARVDTAAGMMHNAETPHQVTHTRSTENFILRETRSRL